MNEKAGYDFDNVKRWTADKKIGYDNIFAFDKILTIINWSNVHWCPLVILIKHRLILYADTLGGDARQFALVKTNILRYFKDEWDRKKPLYDSSDSPV